MISCHKPAMHFINDPAPLSIALTGRGGSKTHSGCVWVIKMAVKFPNTIGLIGASNPAQLNTVAVAQLTKLLDQEGVAWVKGENPPWFTSRFTNHTNILSLCNGAQILLRSFHESGADRNLRGLNLGYVWLDESRELTVEVFDILLACLRDPNGPCRIRLTSTPNGKDWQWRKFLSEEKLKGATCHRWVTHENKHLSPDFAQSLKERLDIDTYNQEVMGEIVTFGNNQVFRFSREKNVCPCPFNPKLPLYYSTDLNVSNMSGILLQYDQKPRDITVIDEIYIRSNGSTQKACENVLLRYGDKIKLCPEFLYMADEAGAARSTRVDYNDIQIMQAAFKHLPNGRSLNGGSKPAVVTSVTALNGLMDPATGPPKLKIDPKCKNLIRDLESVRWQEGEPRKIDKSDPELTHACFLPETEILTLSGPKPICEIKAGDPIVTHLGHGRATWVGPIKEDNFLELEFNDGSLCVVTEDHKWLSNHGWKTTSDLLANYQLKKVTNTSSWGNTIGLMEDIGVERISTYIISTMMSQIITQITLQGGLHQDIVHITTNYIQGIYRQKLGLLLPDGMAQKLARLCINELVRWHGLTMRPMTKNVYVAKKNIRHVSNSLNTVLMDANQNIDCRPTRTILNENVCGVKRSSWSIGTHLRSIVPYHAQHLHVVGIKPYPNRKISWSLESTSGSFCLANGLIVSNSDALRYICWIISQGQMELKTFNLQEIPVYKPNDFNRSRIGVGGNYGLR